MRRSVRRLALLFCALGLGSCVQLPGEAPIVVNDPVIIARVAECNGPGDTPKAANDYMRVGFSNVYAACEAFFVSATRFQQNALATNNTLDSALVGATSIVNATSSTAAALKAITITTAGVVFGKALVNDLVTVYTFGTHLYKVRQLVQNDMDNFVANVGAPADTCIAYASVQTLATKCTLANMQALLDAQVAIPSKTVSTTPGAPTGTATAPPGAVAPRTLRVLPTPAGVSVPSVSSTVIAVPAPARWRYVFTDRVLMRYPVASDRLTPHISFSAPARQAGIHPSQLYGWRRRLRARRAAPDFASVRIVGEAAAVPGLPAPVGVIEIELADGTRLRSPERLMRRQRVRRLGRWRQRSGDHDPASSWQTALFVISR
jgi:transposase-like protein